MPNKKGRRKNANFTPSYVYDNICRHAKEIESRKQQPQPLVTQQSDELNTPEQIHQRAQLAKMLTGNLSAEDKQKMAKITASLPASLPEKQRDTLLDIQKRMNSISPTGTPPAITPLPTVVESSIVDKQGRTRPVIGTLPSATLVPPKQVLPVQPSTVNIKQSTRRNRQPIQSLS